MRNAIPAVLFVIGSAMSSPVLLHAQRAGEGEQRCPIEVRLSLPKRVFAVGESIPVKVQIQNVGDNDLFIGRKIEDIRDWIYTVNLSLYDSRGKPSPGHMLLPPFVNPADPAETFAAALSKWWVALAPGYSYSTTIRIDAFDFDFLRRPGRYRLKGTYSSMGMYAPLYYNRLAENPGEIDKLPFKSWIGEVETNSVWIEIVHRRQPQKKPK